ncbi:uncharacterized protein [Labrus bergylta]|uniref:uncharacterized protein n=1 Tax=Labrus bergylta TaxID=56723 RepID=UPI0009B432FC|nr:uncharacterized protein LOC109998799 [Labrus bergylta]
MAAWTEATEGRLITMIQERPPLFDLTDKLYSNRVVKIALWSEIVNKMIISEKELKKKWESLRTQYTRYKRLPPPGTSGVQKTGRQQWILTRLQFLEPHTKRKETASNLAIREHSLADSDSPSDGACNENGTSAPLEDHCAPLEDHCAPLEDPCAPLDDPCAPLEDPCAPLEDPSSPLKEPSFCDATTGTCAPLAESTVCREDSQSKPLTSTSRSAPSRPRAKRSRRMPYESASEESSDESASEASSKILLRTIRKTLECLDSKKEPDEIAIYCKMVESRMRKLPPHVLPYFQHEVDNSLFKYSVEQSHIKSEVKD